MGFRIARKHARKLAVISLLVGGITPAILLAVAVVWSTVQRSWLAPP